MIPKCEREAAINEAARSLSRLSSLGGRKKLLETLFDAGMVAGAASVDRAEIVSKLVSRLDLWLSPSDIRLVRENLKAVLDEMEKGK